MSNPTTPFSWQMPTAIDLVTDLPADFEVFGQAVATSMADLLGGTSGQILAKNSNTDMDFVWIANDQGDITGITAGNGISVTDPTGPVPTVAINTAVTADLTTAQTLTNKTLTSPALTTPTISTLTTNGDLLYGTGSGALARRGIGSTGEILTVSGGLPVWAAPAGGGKVLQVVQDTLTSTFTTTSATYVDTGLTVTITPSSVSSKIMVFVSAAGATSRNTSSVVNNYSQAQLLRGATVLTNAAFGNYAFATTSGPESFTSLCMSLLDSPATTSATTYKVQLKIGSASAAEFAASATQINSIVVMEIGA